jgi:hypothetical protein
VLPLNMSLGLSPDHYVETFGTSDKLLANVFTR